MADIFESLLGEHLPRNYFNLSQTAIFTAEAGILYPIYQLLMMPDDVITVKSQVVCRQMPTQAPSYTDFHVKTWDVFVSLRSLFKDIYRFMSGFKEYTNQVTYDEPLKRWTGETANKRAGSLWDFLENPINCLPTEDSQQLDFYRQAYGYIWDILFRNQTRQESILIDNQPGSWEGEELLRVNWDRDYFTTSLPNQQLGDPAAIPIVGLGSASWKDGLNEASNFIFDQGWWRNDGTDNISPADVKSEDSKGSGTPLYGLPTNPDTQSSNMKSYIYNNNGRAMEGGTVQELFNWKAFTDQLNNNIIDFKNAGTILISQIREQIALQTFGEINAIAGIRDDEFLRAHYGQAPTDENLLYPEIFGREIYHILTSVVLQTSQTSDNSVLGDMGGQGLAVGEGGGKRFHAKEYGIYMKIFTIKCETTYANQGAKREYTQKSKFDFPLPILQHLTMQPIYQRELVASSKKFPQWNDDKTDIVYKVDNTKAEELDNTIIGYADTFAWAKEKTPRVNGLMQAEIAFNSALTTEEQFTQDKEEYMYNLYNWDEARYFSISPDSLPKINNDFLAFKLDNRNYDVKLIEQWRAQFLVWHNNEVDAWRTLSAKGMPSTLGILKGL